MSSQPFARYVVIALVAMAASLMAQNSVSDVLEAPGVNLRDPVQRQKVTAQLDLLMTAKLQAARAKAKQLGLPLRIDHPNGRSVEIVDFAGTKPLYFTTNNVNAAISTGANLLQVSPYSVLGSGVTVGIWDGGAVRSTHVELTGRVTIKDGAAVADHATHVGGTVGATGVQANAKGMAPSVAIDSYEWTNDKTEMTGRGASYPGEAGKIYLSNHSYSIVTGWNYTGLSSPRWTWYGAGTTSTGSETDFGMYGSYPRDTDTMAFNLPYYLIMRSAGNERQDNPATGDPVSLTTSTASAVSYDPVAHPGGDGTYRSGYDNIGFDAVAKNVITVGSVGDAVSGNIRSLAGATMSAYSSWGPTDDGRIKPDVVANGETLTSSLGTSNTAYGIYSGTSMATPSTTGSAALLVNWWNTLRPGHVLRASTLKGLIIHTADDLGNTGPDYRFGWGLINVKAAADLLQAYKDNSGTRRVIEDQISTTKTSCTYTFTWDGSSALRATLCWTDPAGAQQSVADARSPNLVNNLNLQVTGPTGTIYQPWVMPFVGSWTNANLSAAATIGVNNTDNVERVDIATPSAAGVYTVTVTYAGALTNSLQNFSLILSGGTTSVIAPAPTASAVSPNAINQGSTGTRTLALNGTGFHLGANVKLTKTGQSDLLATNQEIRSDTANVRVDVTGIATGQWNVVLTNPDGQGITLPNAFTVIGNLWAENFETGATGWTHSASPTYSLDTWALSTTQSHSATRSYAASAPGSRNICDLYSPVVALPAGSSNLQLSFWRYFSTTSTRDGVVLEFSVDGGAWFDVTSSGSGASFASGGYTGTLSNATNPIQGRSAWTGSAATWTQTIVSLTDNLKYPGHNLQMRWRMTTNQSGSGTGYYLDDLALSGATPVANQAPTIAADAAATPSPVTSLTTALSVLATDDAGEPALTYTWGYTGGTFERPVTFSDNGTNAAKNVSATFGIAGSYTFSVTVRDAQGLTATSTVDVTVEQTATSVSVMPGTASTAYNSTRVFTGSTLDQFGDALAAQPALTWSTSGGGTINSSGLFTATTVGGPFTITATAGSVTGTANVTVIKAIASVSLSNLAQSYDGTAKSATITTSPAGLATTVTYNNSATLPLAVGNYTVAATISDANYEGSASGTLVIGGMSLSTWTTVNFTPTQITAGNASDLADPDRDGLENLAEYALGTDPNHPTPSLTASYGPAGLALTFTRPSALPDVTYAAESSTDLINWTPINLTLITDGATQTMRALDPVTTGDPTKRFLHLKFARP